jgi:transaldolase
MAVFLDSAKLDDVESASALGFVIGATTNPALLAKAAHKDPIKAMQQICKLLPGPVFHQLTERSVEGMRKEAEHFIGLAPNLGLKIMCTLEGLQFTAEVTEKVDVAVTGVFSSSQAYLAAVAGADYVIPYVNRLTRYTGGGQATVQDMANVLFPTECELLAAGIKTPAEAVETILSGADHISIPIDVIQAMAENDLTLQAYANFDTYGKDG